LGSSWIGVAMAALPVWSVVPMDAPVLLWYHQSSLVFARLVALLSPAHVDHLIVHCGLTR